MNGFFLFAGLPLLVVILFTIGFIIVIVSHAFAFVLYVSGSRSVRDPDPSRVAADELLWVYFVPALNEEVTIRDSIERLRAAEVKNRLIVAINDASTDATPQILQELAAADLAPLHRELPNAHLGKAAALNAAYKYLGDTLLTTGAFADWPREKVIVVVVDADGRLDPQAVDTVAGRFANPDVGGVQVSVRIYNRYSPLTWMQDIEFGIYGGLYQLGRAPWGTAGMGGNGQFNRLAALDSVADQGGPWRDKLTEDQDIGLRFMRAGWRDEHDVRSTVAQQGLSNLRRLYRQRTRWSQGNIQAIGQIGKISKIGAPFIARADLIWSLLQPPLQAFVGLCTAVALIMAICFGTPFISPNEQWAWLWLVFLLFLAFGGTALGCLALGRGRGVSGYLQGLLTVVPYSFYSWILWPVIVRAFWRQLFRRTSWAKTQREPLEPT